MGATGKALGAGAALMTCALILGLSVFALVLCAFVALYVAAEQQAREREQMKHAREDIIRANPINHLDIRA